MKGLKLLLGDRVLIQPEKIDNKTAGGIIIPDMAKPRPKNGTVVFVGQGYRNDFGEIDPMSVKVGDKVLYENHAVTDFPIAGETYLLIQEKYIVAVL